MTSTVWLDYIFPKTIIEKNLLQFLDAFRMQLVSILERDLNFEDTETLYARYPEGGFYKRHSDSHEPGLGIKPRDTERYLSYILYLNDRPFKESDGGVLRMYGNEKLPWKNHIDVNPVPGTLLLFYSQGFQHEVLVTNVKRCAVVGWFRVRQSDQSDQWH